MKTAFFLIVCGLLAVTAGATADTSDRWDSARAPFEAERDFQAGRIKFYWAGTVASSPVGVPASHYQLAMKYPHGDAGIGCIVTDWALRERQRAYAEQYNRKMLSFLLRKR